MIIRFGVMAFRVIGNAKWARPRTSQVSSDFGVDQRPAIEISFASDCSSRYNPSETGMMIDP